MTSYLSYLNPMSYFSPLSREEKAAEKVFALPIEEESDLSEMNKENIKKTFDNAAAISSNPTVSEKVRTYARKYYDEAMAKYKFVKIHASRKDIVKVAIGSAVTLAALAKGYKMIKSKKSKAPMPKAMPKAMPSKKSSPKSKKSSPKSKKMSPKKK